ncbi:exosortase family protein XrtG [Bacillus sp. FJAT-53711]|uniref:Exosortase family protein XrtG n=1 Tax=Bacillus yunxiaonensis TaxID=3127665 RepID=A0ABU8G1J2_9BACI
MSSIIMGILLIALCAFGYIMMQRIGLRFFAFVVGSVGFFTICMMYFLPYIEKYANLMNSYVLEWISNVFPVFHVHSELALITIETGKDIVTMVLDYECSGGIELLVFLSLVLFFPFGNIKTKVLSTIFGVSFLFVANILRLLFIIVMTKIFGAEAYKLVHMVFARILFFGLTVYLYYVLFTLVQIRYQKVGELK